MDSTVICKHLRICCAMMTFTFITVQILSHRLPGCRPVIFAFVIPQINIASRLIKLVKDITQNSPIFTFSFILRIFCNVAYQIPCFNSRFPLPVYRKSPAAARHLHIPAGTFRQLSVFHRRFFSCFPHFLPQFRTIPQLPEQLHFWNLPDVW